MTEDGERTASERAASSSLRSASVFVSYRRGESAFHTERLFENLSRRLPGRLFLDRNALRGGVDFAKVIEQAVGSCQVLIAVIGLRWLTVTDDEGRRRLDDPDDFVRLELATALKREILVIPVLIQGAEMPSEEQLPADLAGLVRRHWMVLSDDDWIDDVESLIRTIEEVLPAPAPDPKPDPKAEPPPLPARRSRGVARAMKGFVLAVAPAVPFLLAGLVPFPISNSIPVLAVVLGFLAARKAARAAGRFSRSVLESRLGYCLIAVLVGLVSLVALRDRYTMPVRIGTGSMSVLVGPQPSQRLASCTCKDEPSNSRCFRKRPVAETVERCWGPLTMERLLFEVAYLLLTVGWGGYIGLVDGERKAKERAAMPQTA